MASATGFSLAEVLAVTKVHPFYNSDAKYPPDEAALQKAKEQTAGVVADITTLQSQPILHKKHLYEVVQRLTQDTSPENTYRRSVYVSTTGGGSGSKPLFFATDALENRRQRAEYGRLLKATGVVKDTDWVISVHTSGGLYRSLDLTLELLENAGATVLAVGHSVPDREVLKMAKTYHVNALSGDASQVVALVHRITTLLPAEREGIHIDKVIYTSETMTPGQRGYIRQVLPGVQICSFLGSAEAGPYGVSVPHLVEGGSATMHQDFVFDTRRTLIEILPLEAAEEGKDTSPTPLPQGEQGLIAQTSLSRLRNPLVRYLTGDVGSVHELPESARKHLVDGQDWPHLRVLRLKGRDTRFSFEWAGEYIEFSELTALMDREEFGVLQWQVILGKHWAGPNSSVEIRVLSKGGLMQHSESKVALYNAIKKMFRVDDENEERFLINPVLSLDSFEVSEAGRKVVRFVDLFKDS